MEKIAYLTFDDGPTENTRRILDILDAHGVKGTFFVEGRKVAPKFEQLLKEMDAQGHYIGLHSMSHDKESLYEVEGAHHNFLQEMLQLQGILHGIYGKKPRLYRPPFGSAGNFSPLHIQTMRDSGLKMWDWNLDPRDWDNATTTEDILRRVKNHDADSGLPAVVLLHEHREETLEALPQIIAILWEKGYKLQAYDEESHVSIVMLDAEGL